MCRIRTFAIHIQCAIHIMLSIRLFSLSLPFTHLSSVCLSNFQITFFALFFLFILTETKYKIHENFFLSLLVNVFVLQMTCQHFFLYPHSTHTHTYFLFSSLLLLCLFCAGTFFSYFSTHFTNIICKRIKINVRRGKWKHGKCICFSECETVKLKLNYHHIPAHNAVNFFTISNFSIRLK